VRSYCPLGGSIELRVTGYKSFQRIFDVLNFIILRPKGLKGINSIHKQLSNAILLEFAVSNNFRSNKQSKKGKSFVGNFKTKNGKHLISGLDREIVYAHDWAKNVDLDLDGFSLVDQEYDPPFDVTLVYPLPLIHKVNRTSIEGIRAIDGGNSHPI
jgi:hypothetical protein